MYHRGGESVNASGTGSIVMSRIAVAVAAALFLVTGCATTPEGSQRRAFEYTPAGYGGYFAVDVASNRALFQSIAATLNPAVGAILGRTGEAAGAFNLFAGAAPEFALVALGDYPKGPVQLALRRDRTLSRQSTEIEGRRQLYFVREDGSLQIAIPESGRIYAATGTVENLLAGDQGSPPPEVSVILSDVGTSGGPDAVLVLPDPAENVLARLGIEARGFPVERVMLALTADETPAEDSVDPAALTLSGAVTMASESQAGLLSRVGRFFILAFMRGLGLDVQAGIESMEIGTEGPAMVFRNIPVREEEIVALIQRMAVSE